MFSSLNFITKFIKSHNQRELDRISKIVTKINSLEQSFKDISEQDFSKKNN